MTKLLDNINGPQDLQNLSVKDLGVLAEEIREYITRVVSREGGHLASSLGIVELVLAMHYAFDFKKPIMTFGVPGRADVSDNHVSTPQVITSNLRLRYVNIIR